MSAVDEIRDRWFDDEPSSAAYAVKHRMADHVRTMTDRMVGLDVEAMTADELADLEAATAALAGRLSGLPDRRVHGPLATAPLPDGALVERSPVSGRGNPLAPPLRYMFDGERTRATAVFSSAYEGPAGAVHGGWVAAAFDELLGVAQMVSGTAGFTGTLRVRYHRLTPVGEPIDYEAGLGDRDGRKLAVWARSYAGGDLVAEAEGLFITQLDLN